MKLLTVALFGLTATSIFAQDQHFTQFYASPLTLNPALVGAMEGTYRGSLIYRDQWKNVLEKPYKTVTAAVDLRLKPKFGRKSSHDGLGIGMVFFSDKVPGIEFSTNQIAVVGAYHKALGPFGDQFLSLGFQAGIAQRAIGYEFLTFNDQFNGRNGYTDPTQEVLPENNYSFGDYSVGLHYTYAPARKIGVFAGLAMHHLLEPQQSFYYNEDLPEAERGDSKLYRKYTAHLGMIIPLSDGIQLSPRGMVSKQGPHMEINSGGNFRFSISDSKSSAIHLGSWTRPVTTRNNKFALDAIVALVGLEYENFLLGLSYDISFNPLPGNPKRQGAFELSLAFLGNYDNDLLLCPKF